MPQRYDYVRGELTEENVSASPFDQLAGWLEEAAAAGTTEPYAMCLSTVSADHRPSGRFVLLRGLDERGLAFYTNYESRKGLELASNPFACVTFWWGGLERQVRVEGRVNRVAEGESDAYFHSRPRESQIASSASPQSRVVSGRDELQSTVDDLRERYGDAEIPRPKHWGGFRLVPDRFEFWQGRAARLHDRIVYVLEDGEWRRMRLAP